MRRGMSKGLMAGYATLVFARPARPRTASVLPGCSREAYFGELCTGGALRVKGGWPSSAGPRSYAPTFMILSKVDLEIQY